jgi:hypothetical protein
MENLKPTSQKYFLTLSRTTFPRTEIREANHRREFIWNRQVSHGGSTRHGSYNGAYVHTSKETRRFSIPLYFYLRVYNPTPIGFPPVDMALRDWLVSVSETGDRRSVQKRLHGFSYSLLKITHRQLETIAKEQGDYPPTASQITYRWCCRYTLCR